MEPYGARNIAPPSSTAQAGAATNPLGTPVMFAGCSNEDSRGRTSPSPCDYASGPIMESAKAVEPDVHPQYEHSLPLHSDQVLPPRMALSRRLPRSRIVCDNPSGKTVDATALLVVDGDNLPDSASGNSRPEDVLNENFIKLSWSAKIGLIADLARGAESIAEGEVRKRLQRLCYLVDMSISSATP